MDGELTRRSANPVNTVTNHKSKVIVELLRGQQLPAEFAQYAKRNGRLGIMDYYQLKNVQAQRPGDRP